MKPQVQLCLDDESQPIYNKVYVKNSGIFLDDSGNLDCVNTYNVSHNLLFMPLCICVS